MAFCCSSHAADTALRLNQRGFLEYTGVEVKPWTGRNASGEIIHVNGNTCSAQHKVCELIPLNDSVTEESAVYHLKDGKTREKLFPGVTTYKNPLGGTTVVFSGTPKTNYNLVEAFAFLTESRKAQLVDLLKRTDALPVYYPEDAEVYLRAAECPDGSLFVALFNLGLDRLDEIPLAVSRPVSRVEFLSPEGEKKECSFRTDGDAVIIDLPAATLDPVILFLR